MQGMRERVRSERGCGTGRLMPQAADHINAASRLHSNNSLLSFDEKK
jgi:hypothetical protein